jgi:hypothetical protein
MSSIRSVVSAFANTAAGGRSAAIGGLFATLLIASCGGGGGGSPAMSIALSVSGGAAAIERDVHDLGPPSTTTLTLRVANAPTDGPYWYRVQHTSSGIGSVFVQDRTAHEGLDIQVSFAIPSVKPRGAYADEIVVEVCEDQACTRPAQNSPQRATVRYTIGFFAPAEPDLPAVAIGSTSALPHDVVDAAYSEALDAVVMVANRPAPALHLHLLASGRQVQVPLATPPLALSLTPDGRHAAIGHDAAVSWIALEDSLGAGASAVRRPVPLVAGVLAADGRGRVHLFDADLGSSGPLTLDIASGALRRPVEGFSLQPLNVLRWAAPGDRLYGTSPLISAIPLFAIDIRGDAPSHVVEAPFFTTHRACGNVWPTRDGARLVTACGATFTTSADPALDMIYAGRLPLSVPTDPFAPSDTWRIVSMAEAPADAGLLLLERDEGGDCREGFYSSRLHLCFTRLAVHDAATLSRRTLHSLGPVTRSDGRFGQIGRYVFRRGNGETVLLSELRGAPDPTAAVLLSRVAR